jgi:putative ABC transport system ATP-binding protein
MLRGSVDELGGTVVMVTHDPRVASYADRVLLLVDGRIESDNRVEGAEQVQRLMQAV